MRSMSTEKTWDEFYANGFLLAINQVLHIFGWAIIFEFNDAGDKVERVFPARVKFRGFTGPTVQSAYTKMATYMAAESETLLKEAKE